MQHGTVNYHVHSDVRQAYIIDAGGVVGKIVSPPHDIRTVGVQDVRSDGVRMSFSSDGVEFVDSPSNEQSFDKSEAWVPDYNAELAALLQSRLDIAECVIFDHTVREDDPNSTRRPARNVHSDYSPEGAEQRLINILGEEKARKWSAGHFGFINVWRPVGQKINSAPLGFVRPSSTQPDDWILIDLVYPDCKGHIMGLVASDAHEWVYASKMAPDEAVIFNIYDNAGLASVAHSAIDLVEDPSIQVVRKSIESQTLVRYR